MRLKRIASRSRLIDVEARSLSEKSATFSRSCSSLALWSISPPYPSPARGRVGRGWICKVQPGNDVEELRAACRSLEEDRWIRECVSMLNGVMLLWFVLTAAALLFVAVDTRSTRNLLRSNGGSYS